MNFVLAHQNLAVFNLASVGFDQCSMYGKFGQRSIGTMGWKSMMWLLSSLLLVGCRLDPVDGFGQIRVASSKAAVPTVLYARSRNYRYYDEMEEEAAMELECEVSRVEVETLVAKPPEVEAAAEPLTAPSGPLQQKIVVLGASGKVGRMVIRKLMEMPRLEATIVAYVRDTSKASWALFCDAVVAPIRGTRGPKLQLVVGNLVPPEELLGKGKASKPNENRNNNNNNVTSKYYGNRIEFVNLGNMTDTECLHDAIKDCTAIISCVGAVRRSNVWSDYLAVPFWRLFRHDVRGWCKDTRHPYYAHYYTTKKALDCAEREQKRREAVIQAKDDRGEYQPRESPPQRIRFVRISDLCLSKQPWELVPIVTNTLQSVVFRYQDMAERLLEESEYVDTVVLRPGDLTDEERDRDTASLQVSQRGRLDYPAVVGREDVAELACAASLFPASDMTNATESSNFKEIKPFHMKLAARWVGKYEKHMPPQGKKKDGYEDAFYCMRRVLRGERRRRIRRETLKEKRRREAPIASKVVEAVQKIKPRRPIKPYGLCMAIPLYISLSLLLRSLLLLPGMNRLVPLVSAWVTSLIKERLPAVWSALLLWIASISGGGVKYINL